MIIDKKLLADSKPKNWVLWFMETVKKFGGEYKPFRDTTKAKKHTCGRRESRLPFYSVHVVSPEKALKMSILAIARRRTYVQMPSGSLRRLKHR